MPLSTSNSEVDRAAWRASLAFLALTALWFVGCELGARLTVHRISKLERGIRADLQSALAVKRVPGGPKQLLAVGNSLMETGLDREALAAGLAPETKPTVVVVHQTSFYDWYFGIRTLLDRGAQPDAVLLMLSADQLTYDSLRGDYTASLLMQPLDIFEAGRDLDLHPTVQSSLLFSTYSRFLGLRVEIRKAVLGRVLLPVLVLLQKIAPGGPKPLDPAVLEEKGRDRLARVNEELAARGVRFIFVVNPSLTRGEIDVFDRLSQQTGVPILMPVGAPGELGPDDFMADGFHLNDAGKHKLTQALLPSVRRILAEKR
jgi:hypothetical protein